jgi:hypothetical protein
VRLPAHFSYNEFNFQIFGACRLTLATMSSVFKKKLRLPANFGYNEFIFKKFAPAGAL